MTVISLIISFRAAVSTDSGSRNMISRVDTSTLPIMAISGDVLTFPTYLVTGINMSAKKAKSEAPGLRKARCFLNLLLFE